MFSFSSSFCFLQLLSVLKLIPELLVKTYIYGISQYNYFMFVGKRTFLQDMLTLNVFDF